MFLKFISVDNRDLCHFSWIKKELRLKKFYREEGSCSSSLWRTIGERKSAYSCCFCRKSTTVCRYSYGSYYSSLISFPSLWFSGRQLNVCSHNLSLWIFAIPKYEFSPFWVLIFQVLFTASQRVTLYVFTQIGAFSWAFASPVFAGPWTEIYLHHEAVWRVSICTHVHKHTNLSA